MGVDFSTVLVLHCQDLFARYVTITPVVSAPGAPAYTLRGIYATRPIQIATEIGMALLSDQQTIFDVRDNEFFDGGYALPVQGDQLNMPADGNVPAEGDFEIIDAERDGGGETTLIIRKLETAAP